jgi:hypothetical protein
MTQPAQHPSVQTKRSFWLALLPCAVLLLTSTLLGGCIVEQPGGHGWGWHHHDDR